MYCYYPSVYTLNPVESNYRDGPTGHNIYTAFYYNVLYYILHMKN